MLWVQVLAQVNDIYQFILKKMYLTNGEQLLGNRMKSINNSNSNSNRNWNPDNKIIEKHWISNLLNSSKSKKDSLEKLMNKSRHFYWRSSKKWQISSNRKSWNLNWKLKNRIKQPLRVSRLRIRGRSRWRKWDWLSKLRFENSKIKMQR